MIDFSLIIHPWLYIVSINMTIHDRITHLLDELKQVLHSLASGAEDIAPVAEAIESVVAPQTVATTEAAKAVAEKIAEATKD